MTLETERLVLRPLTQNDFAAVHSYSSNYENIEYMIFGPNTEDDTRNFISECIKAAEQSPRKRYDFGVVLKGSNRLIGSCGIYCNDALNEGMLGWVLNMNYWQQGYGTELAGELIRFGFERLRLHRIYADCYTGNYGSYRVMERNNMRREGCFLQSRRGRECDSREWYDEYQYAILRGEWETGQRAVLQSNAKK